MHTPRQRVFRIPQVYGWREEAWKMFSPTHSPLPESSSEGEEDCDFPTVEIGTPQKRPKLEIEQTQATKCPPAASGSSSGASNKPPHVSSPPATTDTSATSTSGLTGSPSQSKIKSEAQPDIKDATKAKTRRNTFPSIADELKNLSPLKTDSYRATNESKRTAMKVRKLAKSLKEKTDMERKLEEFRSLNGIQGIAKSEEEKSASQRESPAESNSHPDFCSLARPHNTLPSSIQSSIANDALHHSAPHYPGKAIFIHKPSLITELYPPGVEVQDGGLLGSILTHGSEEDLKNVVCGQMLPVAYIAKSCPIELTQWLFQVMACSGDPQVSLGSLRSLIGLLQYAVKQKSDFPVPSVADITDVLVTLGAERERLHPQITGSGSRVHAMPDDLEREEVYTPAPPPNINLVNITSYISACVRTLADYSVQQLEDLVLILSNLSLDHYCRHFLRRNLQTCIHQVLAAYPESVWHKAVKRLSPQLHCLSPYHQDKVCLARLINGNMSRARYLARDFCRWCLERMAGLHSTESLAEGPKKASCSVSTEECASEESLNDKGVEEYLSIDITEAAMTDKPISKGVATLGTSDCIFLKEVLQSYHTTVQGNMSNEEYYKMQSLLQLLQLYAPLSDLTFPCEAARQDFISLLGTLRSSVREDPMRPITSIVKDVLIRMKLELEARASSRHEKQTNLFSFCS